MALVQLDFFKESDIVALETRMEKVEDSATRCRKKQFAEIGALKKEVAELKETLSILVRNICNGK